MGRGAALLFSAAPAATVLLLLDGGAAPAFLAFTLSFLSDLNFEIKDGRLLLDGVGGKALFGSSIGVGGTVLTMLVFGNLLRIGGAGG